MTLHLDIRHDFGGFVLNTRLEAEAGTTVLFGRSGSGKTSVINAIAGLLTPQSGRITLAGETLFDAAQGTHVPAAKRRIGYVFQDARLFPHLDVAGNLDYGARFAPAPLRGSARDDLIEVLGIAALLDRSVGQLSGGERQRVALGRALMTAPRLLLLDEPLAALDTARKGEILPYLERLRALGGPPMIYVSHDMNEIVRLADRLAVLRDGACVVQGVAEDVLSDPANVPLIGVQDAGALVRGVIEAHDSDGLSAVRLSQEVLAVPRVDVPVGTAVRLRVRAQDVILALEKPAGLSSQNVLPVTVTSLRRGAGPGVAVAMCTGQDRLIARITARAQGQMQLAEGMQVWAILKASAVPATAIAMHDPEM